MDPIILEANYAKVYNDLMSYDYSSMYPGPIGQHMELIMKTKLREHKLNLITGDQ